MKRFFDYLDAYNLYIKKFKECPEYSIYNFSFEYKDKQKYKSNKQFFNAEQAEKIFNNLLDQGYSWINMSFDKIKDNCLFIVFEVSEANNYDWVGKTSVKLCGPSIMSFDISKLPNIGNVKYLWTY